MQDVFLQRIGALVLLAAISASAWNLLGGYAGQVSVGHALYFGVGAYAGLVVYTEWGWPPIAGAPLGVAVSAVLAVVVGLPTFRLRGHYFSMATIAAAELARILAANWPLLGAAVGLMGPPRPRTFADLSFTSPVPYHYLFLAVLLALLGLTARDAAQPHGLLPGRHPRRRPGGAQPRRAGAALQAVRACCCRRRSPRSPARSMR